MNIKKNLDSYEPLKFLVQDEYVKSFTDRGASIPPFLVGQEFLIVNGVEGYLVACDPYDSEKLTSDEVRALRHKEFIRRSTKEQNGC